MDDEYIEEREDFIEHLESRFLYLAADARSTLRLEMCRNLCHTPIILHVETVYGNGYFFYDESDLV